VKRQVSPIFVIYIFVLSLHHVQRADISTYKAESLWNLKKAKIVKEANI
jgi:hypothetical protein